jgi:hypothetical protein
MQTGSLIIARVMNATGVRGVLLGVAFGALASGLSFLSGADRPEAGKKYND